MIYDLVIGDFKILKVLNEFALEPLPALPRHYIDRNTIIIKRCAMEQNKFSSPFFRWRCVDLKMHVCMNL
jgi:hypothetical protein